MFSLLLPIALLCVAVSSELLSRGKPTTESSIYPGRQWGADKAVDGKYQSSVWGGNCFISNNVDDLTHMTVDLNGAFNIDSVTLYNRGDCCSERMLNVIVELLSKSGEVTHKCGVITNKANIYDIPCGNKEAHQVRIRGSPKSYLQICELEVHGEPVQSLISRGKPTKHSSVYNDMSSSLAVDGRYDNFVNTEEEYDLKNCFVSDMEEMPFFVVDLKGTFQIDRVVVYNREDCCSERMINVVVELLYANGEMNHECGKITEALSIYNISCANNVAQKVRVVGAQNDHLQLCEVDVYGRPTSLTQRISRNKPTTQSSVMASLNASLAVDGNYKTYIMKQGDPNSQNCFYTSGDEEPFIEIDLLGKFKVSRIVIHNRMDCCSERIIGSNIDLLFQNGSLSHRCRNIKQSHSIYTLPCDQKPAYKVRVSNAKIGNMFICELDVFGVSALTIISRGKPTSSSSVYEGLDSTYAVDGIYEYDPSGEDGANLFHSNEDEQPFWEVDLKGNFNIDNVVIYNRVDCCSKRMVNAAVELLTETGDVSYECGKVTDIKFVYKIPCGNNVASKVRVKGPPNQFLHFSEVAVYGEKAE